MVPICKKYLLTLFGLKYFKDLFILDKKVLKSLKYLPLFNFDKKPKSYEHEGGNILEVLNLKRVVLERFRWI